MKIVICGNYGATNLGDEAILESILQMVRGAFADARATAGAVRVTVVSADCDSTAAKYGERYVVESEIGRAHV